MSIKSIFHRDTPTNNRKAPKKPRKDMKQYGRNLFSDCVGRENFIIDLYVTKHAGLFRARSFNFNVILGT